ncbi:glycosyltransferase family 2 protein [Cellulomonas sp. URHB0016]
MRFTVVVVAYQAAHRITACLDALRGQDGGTAELDVVVVDNASTDGTADLVAARYPEVRLVRSPTNLGFAAGNNVGLRGATSPWVVLLNDDAVPDPGFLAALAGAARAAAADVAALASTVLLDQRFRAVGTEAAPHAVVGPHGTYVADPEGDVVLVNSTGNSVRVDGYGVDRGWLEDAATHRPPTEVFGFSGAAVALRSAALEQVGLFDETLFMYYEDTDLSWRLRLAGWTVEHVHDAVVRHQHSASSREGSAFFQFHDQRNRLLVLTKDATVGLACRALGRFVLTTASVALRRSQPAEQVRVRLRVLGSATRLLPRMLAARRRIGRTATVPRAEVQALLVPVPARAVGPYRSPARG